MNQRHVRLMPPVCHNFVQQLTFRRPRLSRFSAFATFYPAVCEHIEQTHKQYTQAIQHIVEHESVQKLANVHIKQYVLTEMENAQIFVDALGELCLRYAYNILLTGKTTYAQFITRLDVLLVSHRFMHLTIDQWLDKPLISSVVEVLYKLIHPSTGIIHSFLSSIFSGKLTLIIQNVEKVLGTMHAYTTFDDCLKAIFSTGKSVLFTPLTLQIAKKKMRSAMGETVWAERNRYYQLLRSLLLIPKELMECLVIEINAQHNVDNELFKCFPHYYTPESDLNTVQHSQASSSRFWTRKRRSVASSDRSSTSSTTRRRGLLDRLFKRRTDKLPTQSGGASPSVSDVYKPLIPSLQNLGSQSSSKTPPFQLPKDFLSKIQKNLSASVPEAAALLRSSLQQKTTPKTPTNPPATTTTQRTSKQTQRNSRRRSSSITSESESDTGTDTDTKSEPQVARGAKEESVHEHEPESKLKSITTPPKPEPPKPEPPNPEPSPNTSTIASIPEALQQAWKHQREAEANTREVMHKLSGADVDAVSKQSWWKRMKNRLYTFSQKKENIEFLGLSVLQFSPMQLLCAYLTPVHLHYEGWSDQLTIVAMMYHLQTLDLLPSLIHLGSESYCSHIKNLSIPKTLSTDVQSVLSNRQSKCTIQSKQLHDDYCTTVESLREEAYPVRTLLKTKKCSPTNNRRNTRRNQ